jgi:hypothetical protein
MSSNISDIDIELLFFGKWRFNTSWEKITILFKDDMTYEETVIQTFIYSKPKEIVTGNKFTGVWYVNDKKLHLIVKSMPTSFFNFKIPLAFKLPIADIVAICSSMLKTEKYEVMKINSSKFIIMDREKDQAITGLKIK